MDDLLQRAIETRNRLREELAAIERFIASYGSIKERPEAGGLFKGNSLSRSRREERAEAIRAMIIDAERLILAEGRPLTRSQLLDRLQAEGHVIVGGDKSKVLGTNLWRSGRFLNLKSAGYWPKDEPLPQDLADLERRRSKDD